MKRGLTVLVVVVGLIFWLASDRIVSSKIADTHPVDPLGIVAFKM
jgi:hypothetical protein